MKPKNTKERRNSFLKERRNSFLKFLALFLVTVGTIITAIYFNFKVPKKENTLLKEQAKAIKDEAKFQDEFYKEMFETKKLFDSLEVPGSNKAYLNSLISKKLVDLQAAIPTKDSTSKYDMYTRIVNLHVDLQESKDKLNDLSDTAETISQYEETLDKCKSDYIQLQRDMDVLRSQN